MTSKERIMAVINREKPDHTPLTFRGISHGYVDFVYKQYPDPFDEALYYLSLGLDTGIMIAPYPSINIPPMTRAKTISTKEVSIREFTEIRKDGPYPRLHKEYITPKGTLYQIVNKTKDYPDAIELFSDHNVPAMRSHEYLIKDEEDIEKLEYIFKFAKNNELDDFYKKAKKIKSFCDRKGIIFSGWTMGFIDPLIWLAGVENTIFAAIENSVFFIKCKKILTEWNQKVTELMIDVGVDLIVRRGWYESTDFWSPDLYKKFIFDDLKKNINTAHQAGVKFCYTMNSGYMPLLEFFKELKIDILSNIDPHTPNTNLESIKNKIGKEIALCGGVNNNLILENGTEKEVENAVLAAIKQLSYNNGFILAASDSLIADNDIVQRNFYKMINVWKENC